MNRRKFIEDIGLGSAFALVACKLGAKPTPKMEVKALDAGYSRGIPCRITRHFISQSEIDREWARLGFPHDVDSHPLRYEMARGVLKRVDKPIA